MGEGDASSPFVFNFAFEYTHAIKGAQEDVKGWVRMC
jgi:hypothetical protein